MNDVRRPRRGGPFARAARRSRARREQSKRSPLKRFYWLPPQHAFLSWKPTRLQRAVLLRAGNQAFGKTTCGLAEVIWRCLGKHPFKEVPEPPIEAWVICASYKQSIAIQEKCWDLLPKHRLAPGTRFSKKNGFDANRPMVEFANGSIIRFRTTQQNSLDLAGATIDVALFDEPPSSMRIFGEVRKRLMDRAGVLLMTLTPINAPCEWLREECERGSVVDLHFRLELANLTPVGRKRLFRRSSGEVCDEEWIERVIRESIAEEVPVVCHGEWETRFEGRRFRAFVGTHGLPNSNVTKTYPDKDLTLVVGIDHGNVGANQVAVLLGVDETVRLPCGRHPVYVLDVAFAIKAATTPDNDAEDILEMLDRNGIEWNQLEYVFGDKETTGKADPSSKGNSKLAAAIRRRLRARGQRMETQIHSAKRGVNAGPGSRRRGETWVHVQTVYDGAFQVYTGWSSREWSGYADTAKVVEAFNTYDGAVSSPVKHFIDAIRYGLKPWILDQRGPRRREESTRSNVVVLR